MPQDGSQQIDVAPASQEYLEMAMHPAYKNSRMVSKAAAASRLIVTASTMVTSTLQNQSESFTKKTQPNAKPMTFTPTTHTRVRKINTFSGSAAGLSAKTVGQVSKFAQNFGANLTKKNDERYKKGMGKDGKPLPQYKPGLLNKSLMAFSTIADGIDQAGRGLLAGTSDAATRVVGHKYGAEAGDITRSLGGGVKNVGLVYIDATGVSRRAIIKSVAKGMVVGKVRGGGDLVVGGGDGGDVTGGDVTGTSENWKEQETIEGRYPKGKGSMHGGLNQSQPPQQLEYGSGSGAAPPAYGRQDSMRGQNVMDEKSTYH